MLASIISVLPCSSRGACVCFACVLCVCAFVCLPILHSAPLAGLGRLRPREHPSDYGTPREAHMWRPLTPQHPAGGEDRACGEHYAKLADQCAARQVTNIMPGYKSMIMGTWIG